MMAWAGGYYRENVYRDRGMAQGDPLSPTIFNVVVDAVVCHLEYLVAEGGGYDDKDESSGDEAA